MIDRCPVSCTWLTPIALPGLKRVLGQRQRLSGVALHPELRFIRARPVVVNGTPFPSIRAAMRHMRCSAAKVYYLIGESYRYPYAGRTYERKL